MHDQSSTQASMIVQSESVPSHGEHTSATSGTSNSIPGVLRGTVALSIRTHHAKGLVLGRDSSLDKPAIIGLFGFADRSRVIWNAARADDPYADWWLIKIDAALERARHRIGIEQALLEQCLERLSLLEIQIATSDQRYRVVLQFANPYAYWAAHLIAKFDQAARTLLTAKQVGVLSAEAAARTLTACGRTIRGLLAVPQGYRPLHINRALMHEDGAAARRAIECMGNVPPEVLSGARKAPLAPQNSTSPISRELRADQRPIADTP
ncbi:MAG: TIGR03761 family integrating conjugative element protein [Woeseiaceae bacterium]